jgi:16S rRNA (cytidine1402-2'-O)-methyltransferase
MIHNISALACKFSGDYMSFAVLHVVATPIGNLDDITLRALRVLAEVNVIAAEDTRRTRILLSHHGIETSLIALHEHNEDKVAPGLVKHLTGGQSIALVSDAGTPLLSDPGYRLVRLAVEAGIRISAIPGPSAITAALSISGLATDCFVFEGFLPQKQSARSGLLESLREEQRTIVLFESSHRIMASLQEMEMVLGSGREAAICREMTKQFETVLRGRLGDLRRLVAEDPNQRKGEFVIVLSGGGSEYPESFQKALELGQALREYLSNSQAARVAARVCGVSRRELYDRMEPESNRKQTP